MQRNNKPARIIKGTAKQSTLKEASGVWTLDEAMQAHRANAWPQPNLFQPVANSLRFDASRKAFLSRAIARSGNQQTWTWSGWFKPSLAGGNQYFFISTDTNGNPFTYVYFSSGQFIWWDKNSAGNTRVIETTAVYRDTSAWYHVVLAVDTTQPTAANRAKLYINGVRVTNFNTANYPNQGEATYTNSNASGLNTVYIGAAPQYLTGYLAEVNFVDGYQLDPSLLGKFDTNNTWVPVPYTGSYGTNGFYLPFNNATTSQTLGYDASFNGTTTYNDDQDPYRGSVVLHLTGNGPAGSNNNSFADSSPNNLLITRGGDTTQGSFSPFPMQANTPYNPVVHGASAYFDGSGDRLSLATNASLDLTGDFTIEMWANLSSLPNYSVLFNTSSNGTAGAEFTELWVESTGVVVYYVRGSALLTTASGIITANTWHHIAIIKSGTSQVLYVNGVSRASATSSTQPNTGYSWFIGDRVSGAGSLQYPLFGYISNFRVIKGTAVYTAAFTPTNRPFDTRTNNLLTFSEDFVSGWVASNITFSPSAAIAPDGTPSATLLVPSATSASQNIAGLHDSAAGVNTFSIYAKSAGYRYIQCLHSRSTGADSGYVTFDLTTGAVTNSSVWSGSIVNIGNGWYRLIATTSSLVGTSAGSNVRWFITDGSASRGPSFTGNGTSGVYVWGSQAELASSVSDYAPTPANFRTASSLLLNFANAAVVDSTGAGNAVTYSGATISSASRYGSGALTYNGTSDWIAIGSGNISRLIPGTRDFTVEFWMNTRTGNDGYRRIISSSIDGFTSGTFCIRHQPSNLGFLIGPPNISNNIYSVAWITNTWYHIAYTRQNTTGRFYVNGQLALTCSDNTNYTEAIQYIGANYLVTGELFSGLLDDVRITMGVARYTSDFTPPTKALPETGGESFVTVNVNAGVVQRFTTTGTTSWTAPTDVTSIEVLVVAGGGGGGGGSSGTRSANAIANTGGGAGGLGPHGPGGGGGGGGGGGVIYSSRYPVTPGQTYAVTVGAGGTPGISATGGNGGNSSFGDLIAIGGGGGSSYTAGGPRSGGSGGGGDGPSGSPGVGGAGTAGQGFSGGQAQNYNAPGYPGAGGGGAGAPGSATSSNTNGAAGGIGLQFGISGAPTYYAGGGGGGGGGGGTGGTGGLGGATAGFPTSSGTGTGNGGSGIVIVRYTTQAVANTSDATTDNLVDSPTLYGHDTGAGGEVVGNYATLDPISSPPPYGQTTPTLSNGNLTYSGVSAYTNVDSTIAITSGTLFFEVTLAGTVSDASAYIIGLNSPGGYFRPIGIRGNATGNGITFITGSNFSYGLGDVIGVAFNYDTNVITYFKNGAQQCTGTTNGALNRPISAWVQSGGNASVVFHVNFGQRAWAYAPPQGFNALTTKNLPRLTNAAAIAPNQYFDVATWTQGASDITLTNAGGFQPGLVWIKSRSNAQNHYLIDSVRGATSLLRPNTTGAESTGSTWITFNSNGFTPSSTNTVTNTFTYVGWQWRAGGTAVSNTAGTITSQVSANTASGFSIVTYSGNGAQATVGHGLTTVPNFIMFKQRSSSGQSWAVYHSSVGAGGVAGWLNLTNASSTDATFFNSVAPTNSVFTINTNAGVNASGATYVAYCWTEIPGFSRFGSYTGNGSADGPFVYLGFRPEFVLIKRTDSTGSWNMKDTVRATANPDGFTLLAEDTSAEFGPSNTLIDELSNGFKCRDTSAGINAAGGTYIYMAFAEKPFGNVNGTAR